MMCCLSHLLIIPVTIFHCYKHVLSWTVKRHIWQKINSRK